MNDLKNKRPRTNSDLNKSIDLLTDSSVAGIYLAASVVLSLLIFNYVRTTESLALQLSLIFLGICLYKTIRSGLRIYIFFKGI